jgi:transcription antitermination protein NusB
MSEEAGSPRTPPAGRRRSAARLAAVQALYQIELAGAPIDSVIAEFAHDGLRRDNEGQLPGEVDAPLFTDIVRGAAARQEELDRVIGEALTPDWPLERLERVLRAILRAGTYELLARPDVPAAVVISEYLDIGHAFFAGKEPGLINGVLDRLARTLRPDALAGGEHGGQATAR